MKIVGTVKEVREQVKEWKKQGLSVGFVPTMGYLHEGHKRLMDAARKGNDKVVVSIFVKPMQFGPTEDLATYPRDLDHDAALCESAGVDLIFHPEAEEMYTSSAPATQNATAPQSYKDFRWYPKQYGLPLPLPYGKAL